MSQSQDCLVCLQRAVRACLLYGVEHPRLREVLGDLEGEYHRLLQDKSQIQVVTRFSRVFVDKRLQDPKNLQIKALAGELEEREIHAMLFYPGATREELATLVETLGMNPGQLHELGGAKKRLEEKGVIAIRILPARLEEVSEAGEIAAALLESVKGFAGAGAARPGDAPARIVPPPQESPEPSQPVSPAALLQAALAVSAARGGQGLDKGHLVDLVKGFFSTLAGGTLAPADLSTLGGFLQSAGMDGQGVQPGTQGVVKQAVGDLSPEQRLDVFLGAGRLRTGSLRNLLARIASAQAAPSLATAFVGGSLSQEQLMETSSQLKALSANPEQWGGQLAEALRLEGLSGDQLRELVELLTWDDQPTATKVAKLLEGQRIFEMPQEKVLAFLRELLEAGRIPDFLRLLRHYSSGLMVPAVARRAAVARGFEKIADWVDIPGMPPGVITELMEMLSTAYGREKDPEVHGWVSKAVEHILWFWVQTGEPAVAHAMFTDLQDVVTELSLPAPWKAQATQDLLARLGTPERMDQVLDQLFLLSRSAAAAKIHPYLKMLGPSAANHLAERLSEEPDRARRGRLVEALKACGQVAEAPLLESLKSPEWFVVRNALTVLGEVAGADRVPEILPFLDHGDFRVCRAAIRALGRMGGRSAEAALIPLLNRPDSDAQMEVLFALSEMKSRQAVVPLVELVKRKGRSRPEQERVREKAVEVLGACGSPTVIPVLQDLLARRRGFLRETREPLPMRLAALRALVHQESLEAQNAIGKVLDAEPAGPERDALLGALTETLAGA